MIYELTLSNSYVLLVMHYHVLNQSFYHIYVVHIPHIQYIPTSHRYIYDADFIL